MIKPTVGRVVWFYPNNEEPQPQAAHVAYVHSDRKVNLMVIHPNGNPYPRTSVTLIQPEDATPSGMYCAWMPYQIGQATKYEELKAKTEGKDPTGLDTVQST